MDGEGVIQFAISTPRNDLRAHIDHALSLGLPEAESSHRQISLIANGPGALGYDFDTPGETIAVNGALKLFTDRGKAPDYWICCDPQGPGDNTVTPIDFLSGELPDRTTYLVASKCHPGLFERLKGKDVWLWHVNDVPVPGKRQIPCAVSVTICALLLLHRPPFSYTRVDTYGWDCCFSGEDHHAGPGALSNTPGRIIIEVGDGDFYNSTSTWACEVRDATGVLPVLRWCGTDVVIHGPSMLAAIVPEYAGA